MNEKVWKVYLHNGGRNRVITDLAAQHSGSAPSSTFTRYWFEDPDTGVKNFRERVKKQLGKKLFEEITETNLNQ